MLLLPENIPLDLPMNRFTNIIVSILNFFNCINKTKNKTTLSKENDLDAQGKQFPDWIDRFSIMRFITST